IFLVIAIISLPYTAKPRSKILEPGYAMNDFVIAIGISYLPLHDEALLIAEQIGTVLVDMGKTHCKTPLALDYIRKAANKGRSGFKRKKVRC
ncbi:hypothetical protein, partial [Hungatella effluvii]